VVVLAIDTATRWGGVALLTPQGTGWEVRWHSPHNHSTELAPAVATLLERAGCSPGDLRGLAVTLGPGGFSALRVGLGFAKGLAAGWGIPLVGIGTLSVEAASLGLQGVPLCPLVDLGRGVVAWGVVDPTRGDVPLQEGVNSVEELPTLLPKGAVVCGEGAWTYRQALGAGGALLLAARPPPTRSPLALAHLGKRRLERGEADPVAALQPLYFRPPSIGPGPRGPEGGKP
jgi:tRNA threonylcarbamoyl adenosine modification protein YeaZ